MKKITPFITKKPQGNLKNNFLLLGIEDKKIFKINSFGHGVQSQLNYILLKILKEVNIKNNYENFNNEELDFFHKFKLILFEDPESFLHREAKILINQNFVDVVNKKLNKQQIIIVTHDPLFISLNIQNLKSLFRVFRKSSETKVTKIKETTIENIKKLKHFIWFDGERSSMFLAKYVIICEGQTEKAFFSYMLSSQEGEWSELFKKNFYILDALGKKNIPDYMKICNDLEINHSVLFDVDDNKKNNAAKLNKILNDNIQNYKNLKFTKYMVMFINNFEKTFKMKDNKAISCNECGVSSENKPIIAIQQYLSETNLKKERFKLITKIFKLLLENVQKNIVIKDWEHEIHKKIDNSVG